MKKRLLKALAVLTAAVLALSAPGSKVLAENGPLDSETWTDSEGAAHTEYVAYINFYETDETGSIKYQDYNPVRKRVYEQGAAVNEMNGAVYDKATNTLTITNLSAGDMILETNAMGDDFVLRVEGNCSIGQIRTWGWMHGGTLSIEGSGTLSVNAGKHYDTGIILYAEYSAAALKLGRTVNVNVYGKKNAAQILATKISTANAAMTFANGQSVNVAGEVYHNQTGQYEYVQGFQMTELYEKELTKLANQNDGAGIYGGKYVTDRTIYSDGNIVSGPEDGWEVWPLVYDQSLNAYFAKDGQDEQFISDEEWTESAYAVVSENDVPVKLLPCYTLTSTFSVYQDQSGKKYAVTQDSVNDSFVEIALEMRSLGGSSELYAIYETEASKALDVSELERSVIYEIQDDPDAEKVYNYTLTAAELLYKGGEHTHSWNGGVVTKAATATETGVMTYTCSICGQTKTETIPATGQTAGDKTTAVAEQGTKLTDTKTGASVTVTGSSESNPTVMYTKTTNTKAKSVTIPATVTSGGVTYKVTKVADNALSGNKNVTSVTVGANITSIGKNAFKNCTKLKKVTVKSSQVTTVGEAAFSGDKALTTVDLSKTKVSTIGKNAFSGCKKLKSVNINGNTVKSVGKNAFKNVRKNATITVSAKDKKTYNKVVKMIKKSGAKNVKYKYKKKK